MIKRILIALSVCILSVAQVNADKTSDQVSQWRQSHEQQIVDEFAELLRIPNVASDTGNIRKNAIHIAGLLKEVGM